METLGSFAYADPLSAVCALFMALGYVVSGSGLVSKWVGEKGLLVTGGSSDRVRVWDMAHEHIVRTTSPLLHQSGKL